MILNKLTQIIFNTAEKFIISIIIPIQTVLLRRKTLIRNKINCIDNTHPIYKQNFSQLFKRYKNIQKANKSKELDLVGSYAIFTYIIFILVFGWISLNTIFSYRSFWASLDDQIKFQASSIEKSTNSLITITDNHLTYVGNQILTFNKRHSTISKLIAQNPNRNNAWQENVSFVNNDQRIIITSAGKLRKPKKPQDSYPFDKTSINDGWQLKIGDVIRSKEGSTSGDLLPLAMRIDHSRLKPIGTFITQIPLQRIQERIGSTFDKNVCYILINDNLDLLAKSKNIKSQNFTREILESKNLKDPNAKSKIGNCVFTHSIQSEKYSLTTFTGYHKTNSWIELACELLTTIGQLIGVSLIFLIIIYIFKSKKISPFVNELIAAKEGAEAASVSKSQFLSNINHELRTPMNGIIGMSQALIESEKLKPDELDQANIIYRSADSLMVILNDILNFSKIESKTIDIKRITFSVKDLVEDVADLMSASANYKGIEIVSNVDDNIPHNLHCDVGRIKQILNNLISNAIKFTYYGHITIDVNLKEKNGDHYLINFNVRDSGIGIPGKKIKTLFKVFTQVDMSTTRKYGGTGLGLSICKELVELMDGSIGVESEAEKGSNFYFDIPMQKSKSNIERYDYHAEQRSQILGKNIVTIENNEVVAKKINQVLDSLQITNRTITADNLDKQFMYLLSHCQKNKIDAIIISHNVSIKVNSITLAKKIKEHNKVKNIPIICLMSIRDKLEIGNKGLENFTQLVNKPVKDVKLISGLLYALKENYHKIVETHDKKKEVAKHQDNTLPKLKILICEDNEINMKVADIILQRLGFIIDKAENGQEALNKVSNITYDLVLMDCMMPVMDGFEATRQIRNLERDDPKRKPVTIFALTANAGEEDKNKCLESGMNDFISKPIRKETIQELIKRWF